MESVQVILNFCSMGLRNEISIMFFFSSRLNSVTICGKMSPYGLLFFLSGKKFEANLLFGKILGDFGGLFYAMDQFLAKYFGKILWKFGRVFLAPEIPQGNIAMAQPSPNKSYRLDEAWGLRNK